MLRDHVHTWKRIQQTARDLAAAEDGGLSRPGDLRHTGGSPRVPMRRPAAHSGVVSVVDEEEGRVLASGSGPGGISVGENGLRESEGAGVVGGDRIEVKRGGGEELVIETRIDELRAENGESAGRQQSVGPHRFLVDADSLELESVIE